jgi:hypothetical protein
MAQYIRTPCQPDFVQVLQVTQCSYHEQRIIEIFWDQEHNCVLVQDLGDYFWVTSPDIQHLTIHNVLQALGYGDEQVLVTWTENDQNDTLLNSIVEQAALSQLSIYSPNQPIPQNPYLGPLPVIPGQPIPQEHNPNVPNQPDAESDHPDASDNDDDDSSTLSDIPNFRFVGSFGDSDDDNYYRYN